MSAFCEDKSQIEIYPNGIFSEPRNGMSIRCLQWAQNLQANEQVKIVETAESLVDTVKQPHEALRVAFLPLVPQTGTDEVRDFRHLVDYFSVPSCVLAERIRSVGYAFGSRILQDKTEVAWCHFLCRNIVLDNKGFIQDMGYLHHSNGSDVNPSPSKMWTMCDFFLHVRPATSHSKKAVTLLCFGAPKEVVQRFESLRVEDSWTDIMTEPYLLFDILYDEIHSFFDQAVSKLRSAVKPEEKEALDRASRHGRFDTPGVTVNFQNLHNIQTYYHPYNPNQPVSKLTRPRNCVFMVEAAEASIATLDAVAMKLRRLKRNPKNYLTAVAIDALECRKRNFHSTSLRLQSIEKRMLNVIQLTQTIVNQADSAVLKADSRAMKLIAVLTLVFLPATGVASIFDTPFFDNDSDATATVRLIVAANFWIFWAVSIPLTLGVGFLCFAWYYVPKLPNDHPVKNQIARMRRHWPGGRIKASISRRGTNFSQQGQEMGAV